MHLYCKLTADTLCQQKIKTPGENRMKLFHLIRRLICQTGLALLIAGSAMFVSLPAQAGMLGTSEMTHSLPISLSTAEITQQRSWLQKQLEANGVNQADAALRVSSLSDSQIQQVNQRVDEMPAGAGVVGIIALGFLVLAITDLIGITDVFPFIRPQN